MKYECLKSELVWNLNFCVFGFQTQKSKKIVCILDIYKSAWNPNTFQTQFDQTCVWKLNSLETGQLLGVWNPY